MFAYVGLPQNLEDLKNLKDPKRSRDKEKKKSNPAGTEGSSALLWILFTERWGVCLCFTKSKPKESKGPERIQE